MICPFIFKCINLIFQRLSSREARIRPNTCSKIPRQSLSRWMVPATATSTNPCAVDTHFRPLSSRLGQKSNLSSQVRAKRRLLTSSAPKNSSVWVWEQSSSLASLQKCCGPQSCTGWLAWGFWEFKSWKNHWQNCFPRAVRSAEPSPVCSVQHALVAFTVFCDFCKKKINL